MSRTAGQVPRLLLIPLVGLALLVSPMVREAEAVAAAPEAASEPARDLVRFDGIYRHVGDPREQERAYAAVEDTVAGLNVVLRPLARKLLRKTATATPEYSIRIAGDRVTVAGGGHPGITASVTGKPTVHKGMDGKKYRVSYRLRDGVLIQKFVGNNSVTTKRFKLSADGARFVVRVRIEHPMMVKPLEYRFTYRRA